MITLIKFLCALLLAWKCAVATLHTATDWAGTRCGKGGNVRTERKLLFPHTFTRVGDLLSVRGCVRLCLFSFLSYVFVSKAEFK